MHQVRQLHDEDAGVPGLGDGTSPSASPSTFEGVSTPDQLVEDLLDWRERVSAFVSACEDRGQLAILAVELENALEFDLQALADVKAKVREMGG